MRVFIGVEFSKELKKNIINIQKIIRENSESGRWKYIDNFHLTLKFLGEVSKNQIESIFNNLEKNLKSFPEFIIETGSLGYFEGNNCYRVVYLNIVDKNKFLEKAYRIVEEACILNGIEKDRRKFTPHITIAQDVKLKNNFEEVKSRVEGLSSMKINVNSINIIKSEQIDNKRVYTPIFSIKLNNPV